MMFCRSDWEDESLSMQEMVERRIKELGVKGIKKNSTKAIEVIVSVSDPTFFNGGVSYDPLGYGSNEMKWLEDTYFGQGNVVCGYLHEDESKPHTGISFVFQSPKRKCHTRTAMVAVSKERCDCVPTIS